MKSIAISSLTPEQEAMVDKMLVNGIYPIKITNTETGEVSHCYLVNDEGKWIGTTTTPQCS